MNSDELRALISRGPFSQRSASYMLDIPNRDMRHYCAATLPVPRIVEFALRYCVEHPNDPRIREFIRPNDPESRRLDRSTSTATQYHAKDSPDPAAGPKRHAGESSYGQTEWLDGRGVPGVGQRGG